MNDIARGATFAPEHTAQQELDALWMPFTANRQFKDRPRMLARAEGMHYYTPEGARCWTAPPGCGV